MKRIYEDSDGCLFIATSATEAADHACCVVGGVKAWTDEQMQAQVMSEESRLTHGIESQTWQEWVDLEQVGFLLDPRETFEEIE